MTSAILLYFCTGESPFFFGSRGLDGANGGKSYAYLVAGFDLGRGI